MKISSVKTFLLNLQQKLIGAIEKLDEKKFVQDTWDRAQGGGGITSVVEEGSIIERGGVNFSHIMGEKLPPAASDGRPHIVGSSFEAMGISVVLHPQNPFIPTIHMNIRFFVATSRSKIRDWWFGGGIDLTPYYGIDGDIKNFHRTLKNSLDPFGLHYYPQFKKQCDEYFFIKHRNEARGVGGVFFDDLSTPDFQTCFAISKSVALSFLPAYIPIVEQRKDTKYGERERDFQLYRRGRYVEFNLVHDRGTLFGLQSQGRIESILMSMPPIAKWKYSWQPDKESPEGELTDNYLVPKDWISE